MSYAYEVCVLSASPGKFATHTRTFITHTPRAVVARLVCRLTQVTAVWMYTCTNCHSVVTRTACSSSKGSWFCKKPR